jgi:hypothetical protein
VQAARTKSAMVSPRCSGRIELHGRNAIQPLHHPLARRPVHLCQPLQLLLLPLRKHICTISVQAMHKQGGRHHIPAPLHGLLVHQAIRWRIKPLRLQALQWQRQRWWGTEAGEQEGEHTLGASSSCALCLCDDAPAKSPPPSPSPPLLSPESFRCPWKSAEGLWMSAEVRGKSAEKNHGTVTSPT